MATSTTTAIELSEPSSSNVVSLRDPNLSDRSNRTAALDPILEASRLADSTVPDGGYGWIVVAGCTTMAFWFVGQTYAWGVIQDALVHNGLSTPAIVSWVGSLSCAVMSSFAMINSKIIRKLGVTRTAMLGVSLLGLAEILSGFTVHSVGALFITEGVMLGLGMGLCFMTVSVTPAQYFSKKRGLANGIVFAGGGAGGAVMSLSLDALIQHLGPAWAFRALGIAMLATGLPAAWFIKERTPVRTGGFIEWRLFRNPSFVLIFFAGAVATFPLFVPPFFLPLYTSSLGFSSGTGAGIVAGFSAASGLGRVLSGHLGDTIGPLNSLFISLLLSGISMLALWPVSTNLASITAFVIINGLANGGFFSIMPTVVGNVFGSARVAVAMGMILTSWSGGYLLGAPIAGYLLDAYGGEKGGLQAYRPAMFYAGSMALAATALVQIVRWRQSKSFFAKI